MDANKTDKTDKTRLETMAYSAMEYARSRADLIADLNRDVRAANPKYRAGYFGRAIGECEDAIDALAATMMAMLESQHGPGPTMVHAETAYGRTTTLSRGVLVF